MPLCNCLVLGEIWDMEFAHQKARIPSVAVYLHYLDVVICPLFLDHVFFSL